LPLIIPPAAMEFDLGRGHGLLNSLMLLPPECFDRRIGHPLQLQGLRAVYPIDGSLDHLEMSGL
jgi:hypothetical protein